MARLPREVVRRRKPRSPEEWFLGPLEARVLRALMDGGPGNVSDVVQRLRPALAYTTVMTELAMLHRMGLAERHKQGRGYRYEARMDHDELRQAMAAELIAQVREDFGSYFRLGEAAGPAPKRRRPDKNRP